MSVIKYPDDGIDENVKLEMLNKVLANEIKCNHILKTVVYPVTNVPDIWNDLTSEKQADWTAYKDKLESFDIQYFVNNDTLTITWPTKPT